VVKSVPLNGLRIRFPDVPNYALRNLVRQGAFQFQKSFVVTRDEIQVISFTPMCQYGPPCADFRERRACCAGLLNILHRSGLVADNMLQSDGRYLHTRRSFFGFVKHLAQRNFIG
jgi:hypothetical protein